MATVTMLSDSRYKITRTIQDLRIPSVKKRRTDVVGQMYTIEWPESNETSLSEKLNTMMGSISLFASDKHERDAKRKQSLTNELRPVTPINEEIRSAPTSLKLLQRYLRRRLQPRPSINYVTDVDQQALADILINEVQFIWQDIKHQIDDPFLTSSENSELSRRMCVYVVKTCESLFDYHLAEISVLHDRKVFTDVANRTRIKARIAVHAHELLNVLLIRRHIVEDLHNKRNVSNVSSLIPMKPRGQKSSADVVTAEASEKLTGVMLELDQAMPPLDMQNVIPLLQNLFKPDSETDSEWSLGDKVVDTASNEINLSSRSPHTLSWLKLNLPRSESMPSLRGETLMEELGLDREGEKLDSQSMCDLDLSKYDSAAHVELSREEKVRNDLQNLMIAPNYIHDINEINGLPPLVQAITQCHNLDGKNDKYRTILREMEEKEAREAEKKKEKRLIKNSHQLTQPDTIEVHMPNNMVVKTSDVRVSNRVSLSAMFLHNYTPLYNDLFGEISTESVTHLDHPLYMKAEIREVYTEIMKSISHAHFQVSNDTLVEKCPVTAEWDKYDLLNVEEKCRARGKIVNKQLAKGKENPWGIMGIDDWCMTPQNQDYDSTSPRLKPDLAEMNARLEAMVDSSSSNTNVKPSLYVEKMRRMYENWITWWKNNISHDDYQKYISFKKTDYLAVIFHLYEDQTQTQLDYLKAREEKLRLANLEFISAKKNEQMQQMRKVKDKYEKGVWNISTVMMGGLGSDPPLDRSLDDFYNTDLSKIHGLTHGCDQTGDSQSIAEVPGKTHPPAEDSPSLVDLQVELERIWIQLKMPESQRLDMAIKYSSVQMFAPLQRAVVEWDYVVHWILKREDLMSRLERFERYASDPDRFFHKGKSKSSVSRFEEAKQRQTLYTELELYQFHLNKLLPDLKKTLDDVVTYNGRDYSDKMKWDKMEMLYWLQEERKQNAIKYEVATHKTGIKPSQLQPLFM